ncbi:MAG: hypothetical protein P4N59_20200 [Negativicutes bacterium]|nr:hypothetical protein [Negativicutes bacterium]
MLRRTCRGSLFSILLYFLVSLSVVYAHPQVQVMASSQISDEVKQDTQFAIDKTIEVFKEKFNLGFNRNAKVFLVSNDEEYLNVLVSELHIDKAEAERRVRTTSGWSSGNIIILDVRKAADRRDNIFTVAHEMTHQFQNQEDAGKHTKLEWIAEGMADNMAAVVVEKSGRATLAQYKKWWTDIFIKAKTRPYIYELHTPQNWYSSLDKHGTSTTYRIAGLAMMHLTETKGYEPILGYMHYLRDADSPEKAFVQAYGMELSLYEKEYEEYLRQLK